MSDDIRTRAIEALTWASLPDESTFTMADMEAMVDALAAAGLLVTPPEPPTEGVPPWSIEDLLEVYEVPLVREIAFVLWGSREVAAKPSHRPDDVRRLFCDANASHVLAAAVYKLIEPRLRAAAVTPEQRRVLDAAVAWGTWTEGYRLHKAVDELHAAVAALRASQGGE